MLRVLQSRESKNVPQIARATGTSRQNIQMVVNRLQRSGYIELMTNPSHKRSPRVVLTERGKPIAVIKPLEPKEDQEAVIRRLEAEGLLRPPLKRGPMPKPTWKAIRVKGKLISQTISEERDER